MNNDFERDFSEASRQFRRLGGAVDALDRLHTAARLVPIPSSAVLVTLGIVREASQRLLERYLPALELEDPHLAQAMTEELQKVILELRRRLRDLLGAAYADKRRSA